MPGSTPVKGLLLPLAVAALVSCHKAEDQAAKARIFSPEEPPKFITRAAENLGAETLETSGDRIRRVWLMTAAEAAERLGPHHMASHVEFAWTKGAKQVSLDEDHALTFGSQGDFLAVLALGDKPGETKQGMEIERLGGHVWARARFGHFRERVRDRGAAERYRDEVYGSLAALYQLFHGRVALINDGVVDSPSGRRAVKFTVALAQEGTTPTNDPGARVPAPVYPKDGPDPHLRRELDLEGKGVPRSLEGTLLVDQETAAVLDATLRGSLDAPGDGNEKAQLEVTLDEHITDIGKDPKLAPPKDALPDEGRPQGIAAALERFDLPRVSHSDGGSSEAEESEEP